MSQGERKAKAVLTAALEWREKNSLEGYDEFTLKLEDAVDKYKEVMAVELPPDPTAFFCPHCDAAKPPYGWHYNAGDTGPFAVAYLTCYCGECKKIISVVVTTFMPSEQLAAELMRSFKQKMAKPS